ncbi:MAG: hypothetical protein A2284_17530 [Deltaproteobacteria bacterium RIFOXYA12_FULL_61_11]|nr:MAG: hypothetical protein A2284_17530 [Deltaproteobacteria bacterium RIFOXYA12_FULL_61_11]
MSSRRSLLLFGLLLSFSGLGSAGATLVRDEVVHRFPDPVNIKNGNLYLVYEDLYLPASTMPLVLQRTYNSYNKQPSPFGYGWSFNFQYKIMESPRGFLLLIEGDGYTSAFVKDDQLFDRASQAGIITSRRIEEDKRLNQYQDDGYYRHLRLKLERDDTYFEEMSRKYLFIKLPLANGIYVSKARGLQKIKKSDKGYVLLTKQRQRLFFDAQGRLTKLSNSAGKSITFNYRDQRLISISDPYRRTITFTYNRDGYIARLIDPTKRSIRFEYDERGDLIEVHRGKRIERFEYGRAHELTKTVYPDGTATAIEYDVTRKAVTKLLGPGTLQTTIGYRITNWENKFYERVVTDPNGVKTTYLFEGEKATTFLPSGGKILSYTNSCCNSPYKIVDAANNTLLYEYDEYGNVLSFTTSMGAVTKYTYDDQQRLTSISNHHGTSHYRYDKAGNVVDTELPGKLHYRYGYDKRGDLVEQRDPENNLLKVEYDQWGNPAALVDEEGQRWLYRYDLMGRLLETRDPRGGRYRYEYDDLDRLVRVLGPGRDTVRFAYDLADNVTSLTDQAGHTVNYRYDQTRNLVTLRDPEGGEQVFDYDAGGRLTTFRNTQGQRTAFSYDAKGNLQKMVDPLGTEYSLDYDHIGRLVAMTSSVGYKERYRYDAVGRLIAVDKHDQPFLRLDYQLKPPSIRLNDSFDNYLVTTFDVLGRPLSVVDKFGNTLVNEFDGNGNLLGSTLNGQPGLRYAYDRRGKPRQVSLPKGDHGVTYKYDGNGNLASLTDLFGRTTSYEYGARDELVAVTHPSNRGLRFEHDSRGLITAVTLPDRGRAAYAYDKLGRLRSYQYRDDAPFTYKYDQAGHLVTLETDDRKLGYVYDDLGQVLQVLQDGKVLASYRYNADGTVAAAKNDETMYEFEYDGQRRLMAIRDLTTSTAITYQYDRRGHKTGFSLSGGDQREWKLDKELRISAIKRNGKDLILFDFDAKGRLAGERYPVLNAAKLYHHDDLGRLTRVEYQVKGRNVFAIDYQFDQRHNVIRKVEGGRTWTYAYDEHGRLTKADLNGKTKVEYRYDGLGNRVWQNLVGREGKSVYQGDRLVRSGEHLLEYDRHGNVIAITTDGATTRYRYDHNHQLVEVTRNGTLLYSLGYDPFGRRYRKTDSRNVTTHYLYDGLNAVTMLQGRSKLDLYHGFIEMNPVLFNDGSAWFLPVKDGLENVLGLINAKGEVVDLRLYLPFGTQLSSPRIFPFGFNSKLVDLESGLVPYLNRQYHPELGRFLSRDPLGVNGELNSYTYVDNNPQTFADPLGLKGFNYFLKGHSLDQQQAGLPLRYALPGTYLPHGPSFPGALSGVDNLAYDYLGNPVYHNPRATRTFTRHANDRIDLNIPAAILESAQARTIGLTVADAGESGFLEHRAAFTPTFFDPTPGKMVAALARAPFEAAKTTGQGLWRGDSYFLNLFVLRPGDPELVSPGLVAVPAPGRGAASASLGGFLRLGLRHSLSQNVIKRFLSTRSDYAGGQETVGKQSGWGLWHLASSTLRSSLTSATSFLGLFNLLPSPYSLTSLAAGPNVQLSLGGPPGTGSVLSALASPALFRAGGDRSGTFPFSAGGVNLPATVMQELQAQGLDARNPEQLPVLSVLPGLVDQGNQDTMQRPDNGCY